MVKWMGTKATAKREIEREKKPTKMPLRSMKTLKNKNPTIQRNIWHVLSFVVRNTCCSFNVHNTILLSLNLFIYVFLRSMVTRFVPIRCFLQISFCFFFCFCALWILFWCWQWWCRYSYLINAFRKKRSIVFAIALQCSSFFSHVMFTCDSHILVRFNRQPSESQT